MGPLSQPIDAAGTGGFTATMDSVTAVPEPVSRLRTALDAAGATYRILRHEQTFHSALDGVAGGLGTLAQMTPTLILRSEEGYLAAIICGDTKISWKKIRKQLGLRNVALAPPEEVLQVTGAAPGAVAMVNAGLRTLVDERVVTQAEVFGGCGVPNYSLAIAGAEVAHATAAVVFDFTEARTP